MRPIRTGESSPWECVGIMFTFAMKVTLIHPVAASLIVRLNSPEQLDQALQAADVFYPAQRAFDASQAIFLEQGVVVAP